MSSYVCVDLDTTVTPAVCSGWAQTWSWPALSMEDAATILAAILVCWALAFGFRLLANHLLNRG